MSNTTGYFNTIFLLLIVVMSESAIAQDCEVHTLDWSEQPIGTVALTSAYTVADEEFIFSLAGNTEAAQQVNTPAIFPFYQGDLDSVGVQYLIAAQLVTLQDDEIRININAGRPGNGVDRLSFKLFDVDGEIGRFLRQEEYRISGELNGNEVLPSLVLTDNMETAGDTTIGLLPVASTDGDPGLPPTEGVLSVSFSEPVERVQITFSINNGVTPSPGSAPGFGIDNLHFCTVEPVRAIPTLSNIGIGVLVLTMLIIGVLKFARNSRTDFS